MESMTPSVSEVKTTTAGQIDKAVSNYRALLEKHAPEFGAEPVQTVLGQSELAGEMFDLFRRRVEAVSNIITRRVKVDRTRTPEAVLAATGRKQYVTDNVVATMPKGDGNDVTVHFFKLDLSERNGYISDNDLEKEFDLRGLKPADPYSPAAVNEADPVFADEHPNATHWKDANGKWCFATFRRWRGGRYVGVYRNDFDWGDDWWFAGLRK